MAPRIQNLLFLLSITQLFFQSTKPQDFSSLIQSPESAPTRHRPSAVFVFGDSLVDPGNNNYIPSLAKANLLYNGIDFPGGPTGRFCNGRTVVDVLCDLIKAPYPPPFFDPNASGPRILRGVNYASGAGGILDDSGANFLSRVPMNRQISFFQDRTLVDLQAQLGTTATDDMLGSSLAVVIIGSNDFVNNYFLEGISSRQQYTPAQFNIILLNSFATQLKTLYNLGLRKFYVSGIGPVGCIPHLLAANKQPFCVSSANAQAQDFNTLVGSMLQQFNKRLTGAIFLHGNAYNSLSSVINNPDSYGFKVVNQGCCGGGLYRGEIQCSPAALLCINRVDYVFWDPYHPSEASNIFLANAVYSGGLDKISPMNIQQLFAIRPQLTSGAD